MFFRVYIPIFFNFATSTIKIYSYDMRIQNLEETGIVKFSIICNDIFLIVLSYWLAFAYVHGFSLAFMFPYALKILMILGGLTIVLASHIIPPVFLKRFTHGNDILTRTIYVTGLQTFFMLILMTIIQNVEFIRTEILIGALIFTVLLFSERILFHKYCKYNRAKGKNNRHIIFVGHPWLLTNIYDTFKDKSLGFSIQGIFTRQNLPEEMDIPILGYRHDVIHYLETHPEISEIYVAPDADYEEETLEIFRYCEDHMIRFYALPIFQKSLTKRMKLSHVGNTMLLSVRNEPLQDLTNRFIKRSFDILVSGIFMLTIFPVVYIIVGIIIKMQSPGPVIFKQKRNGLDGREFYCLKFRSMHVNKDADRLQATENDPRKFKFGDIMRRTNIDELPQFFNVFRGDMSLVGPRPHMLKHTQEYSQLIHRYMIRHLVKPGITGWAQVQGFRGETKTVEAMEDRVKADIWYLENWSFSLDILIMWRTVMNMIHHNEKNAY